MTEARVHHVRTTALAMVAALAVLAPLAGTAAASAAPAHPPVVFDYWRGFHYTRLYGAIRPGVLGASYGEPLQDLRWQSWRQGSASGRGEIIHMSCQPCGVTVQLSAPARSHGSFYFSREKVTYFEGRRNAGSITARWSWRSRNYS
jgi:hypothetical protein